MKEKKPNSSFYITCLTSHPNCITKQVNSAQVRNCLASYSRRDPITDKHDRQDLGSQIEIKGLNIYW